MHIELVELLRCVQPHDDTWLVATVNRIEGREIVSGTLGCPICRGEYPIRDRVVYFAPRTMPDRETEPDPTQAIRIAAALDLTDARRIAVLQGAWGMHARLVRSASPAQLIVIDPPSVADAGGGVNVIVGMAVPLARRSVRGVALDSGSSPEMTAALVDALRPGGRMLASVGVSVPAGLSELARDDEMWVAERLRDDVVPLRRTTTGRRDDGMTG
jgi:hypothetical protein